MNTAKETTDPIEKNEQREKEATRLSGHLNLPEEVSDEEREMRTRINIFINPGRLRPILLGLCAAVLFVGCSSPAKKVDDAKENVTKAKEELSTAKAEYSADMEKYRFEANARIAQNELEINNLKSRLNSSTKKPTEEYRRQILELEQQNKDLKRKIADYRGDSRDNWYSFKAEFNRDLDELGKSLKNFASADN